MIELKYCAQNKLTQKSLVNCCNFFPYFYVIFWIYNKMASCSLSENSKAFKKRNWYLLFYILFPYDFPMSSDETKLLSWIYYSSSFNKVDIFHVCSINFKCEMLKMLVIMFLFPKVFLIISYSEIEPPLLQNFFITVSFKHYYHGWSLWDFTQLSFFSIFSLLPFFHFWMVFDYTNVI